MAVRLSSTVAKVLVFQLLIVVAITVGFALGGWHKALSAMAGGIIAFVPNLYFALRVSANVGQEAKKIVRSFYAGESVKLLLTALLFALIIQIPKIEILPLLAGYIAALSVFWFALLIR